MATSISVPKADVDLTSIGNAWAQDAEANYVFSELPRVIASGVEDGFTGVTNYDLVKLGFAFNSGGGNQLWQPGQAIPSGETIPLDNVSFRLQMKRASVLDRNLGSTNSRYADLKNPLPSRLSQLLTGIQYDLRAFLVNTSVFGSAKTFTGAALDTPDYSNQIPWHDIEGALNAFRQYQMGRFQLWCIMDQTTLHVLRGRPEYTGAGEGSNSAAGMPMDAFKERFAATHRLNKVLVMDGGVNNAAQGATKTSTVGSAVLWFGIIDTQAMNLDLRASTGDKESNPDGSLILVSAPSLTMVRAQKYEDLGIERFNCTAEYGFVSPRGSAMACFFAGTDIRST